MASVTTEAALCNLALTNIGETQLIDSLDAPGHPARLCKVHYVTARNALLQRHWWRFATRRADLAATLSTRSGWTYVYALPADCLAVRFIWNGYDYPPELARPPFTLEVNDAADGQVLLTDWKSAELVYTTDRMPVARFSDLFVTALAWEMSVRLALSLPKKQQLALGARQEANRWLSLAAAADSNQGQAAPQPDSPRILARR